MRQAIRAVYTQGHLRLLEPVPLDEGQEIEVMILSERDRIRAALGDLVARDAAPEEQGIDEAALLHEVENAFRGHKPLSEAIIEERREGR